MSLAPACRGSHGEASSEKPAATARPPEEVPRSTQQKATEPLAWAPLKDTSPFGLPAGCALKTARHAKLPGGVARFAVASGATSELVLAVDENADGAVDRASVLDSGGRAKQAVPWSNPDAPPVLALGAAGVVAIDRVDEGNGRYRAELWRPPGLVRKLAEGDGLEVIDAACDGPSCAILTTVASESAGPGATLFVGDPAAPAPFARVDLAGDEEGWMPLSIPKIQGRTVWVALSTKAAVSVVRVENGKPETIARRSAPIGTYDVALGDVPIAIEPGEPTTGECTHDSFDMKFVGASAEPKTVDVQVPPETLVAKPLAKGFFVAWLAPLSCRHKNREMVRALLLGDDGSPKSSTMAVATADGFATRTTGDLVDLWLSMDGDLVWLESECHVPEKQ